MSDLFQLTPTSPELFQHNPLSMLSDLFISKLTFNGPLGAFCHALIRGIQVQEFYHFLPSTYHVVNQDFSLFYFISLTSWLTYKHR